ncbi:MAG: Lrp/AsnC family transcriptional regulator [Clostridia bacterium]|nr:Lrp/AsnC family transcriptional regulator [Clostridiales bacterium]MBQ3231516.1 Lrp/AsnC family transcriptional regulator [Clostridia bacterium]
MISEFEMTILEILAEDARTDADRIAVMTGKSKEEVEEAISRLEKERILLKYPAMVNWDRVREDVVQALIEVRVTPQRDEGFDAIAEKIYRFEEVKSVYLMSGAYDLLVIVEGANIKQLAIFVGEKLSTLENVLSTATHFVLKKYKQDGVIMEKTAEDDRLQVSP